MPRRYANLSSDELFQLGKKALSSKNSVEVLAILDEFERHRNSHKARGYASTIRTEMNNSSASQEQTPPDSLSHVSRRTITEQKRPDTKSVPGNYPPTLEQQTAIAAFKTGKNLRVSAFAGSGKTSTLVQLSHSTVKRGIYLAFNKKIVDDSSGVFPGNVTCSTIHSLAYRATIPLFKNSAKMKESMNALRVVELFQLRDWEVYRGHVLGANTQGQAILGTVRKYCQSQDIKISVNHVLPIHQLFETPDKVRKGVAEWIAKAAEALWRLMSSQSTEVPLGHDGYLKVWALSNPQIVADFILLDEAQDTNPVVLGVLERQRSQLVLVGDRHQQIYEWRGAVNAMEQLPVAHSTTLTVSFRFGPEIAALANKVLRLLGEKKEIRGNEEKKSSVGPIDRPDAVLARTNAATLQVLIESLDADLRPHLVGGVEDLRRLLNGVRTLKQGKPTDVPEFFGFQNWQEVLVHVRTEEVHELSTFVNLVESRGENQLFWALGRCVDEQHADIAISTVHKSKGRQWDKVRVFNDFFSSTSSQTNNESEPNDEKRPQDAELRLLYVAITRAKNRLEIPETIEYLLKYGKLMPQQHVTRTPPKVT